MVSNRSFLSGAAAIAVAATSVCFVAAQDAQVQQAPQAQPVANEGANGQVATYRAKQLIGSKVAIQGNAAAGTIDDIVLDDHGNVDYLIVATAEGQLVTVPWDAAVYNAEKRVATVQITPENFKQVPTYTTQQYPVYSTPAYRTQVYKYYGLTPGQARRAIRRTLP